MQGDNCGPVSLGESTSNRKISEVHFALASHSGKECAPQLNRSLSTVKSSSQLELGLSKPTEEFIAYLDKYGKYRYLEISHYAFGSNLVRLDRAVWELRRFCTMAPQARQATLRPGHPPPKVPIPGGKLEHIIGSAHWSRDALVWQNAFFGKRARRIVKHPSWFTANNSLLSINPHILDEVTKYVYLPTDLIKVYQKHANDKAT